MIALLNFIQCRAAAAKRTASAAHAMCAKLDRALFHDARNRDFSAQLVAVKAGWESWLSWADREAAALHARRSK